MKKIILLLILLLQAGCSNRKTPEIDKPDSLPEYAYDRMFPLSPFHDSIPANAELDPNSAEMVKTLVAEKETQGMIISLKKYTVPVYFAGVNTPRYDVLLTASWAPVRKLLNVPIPDYAEPDPAEDGHLVVIDTVNGCEYDFWQARKVYGRWIASWGNAIPLNSDGIFNKGYSARGSGFALTQGLITPEDLKQGEIKHALIFSYSSPRGGGPVPPATESDGFSEKIADIPEGALVRLNPHLNLDSLSLTSYEKIIARALQKYGMYCADAGGGIQLYAVNPVSAKKNPYRNLLPDETYIELSHIPVSEFQVIKLPPQIQEPNLRIIENACAKFR